MGENIQTSTRDKVLIHVACVGFWLIVLVGLFFIVRSAWGLL